LVFNSFSGMNSFKYLRCVLQRTRVEVGLLRLLQEIHQLKHGYLHERLHRGLRISFSEFSASIPTLEANSARNVLLAVGDLHTMLRAVPSATLADTVDVL
jgi:hypothetical protein